MSAKNYSESIFLGDSDTLLRNDGNTALKDALIAKYGQLDHAFVLDWIPEQGEDIYTVAIPPDKIVLVEIPRKDGGGDDASIEEITMRWPRFRGQVNC